MDANDLLPNLDGALLKKKTDEAALKGALDCIESYYTGYNSPFKKAIEEELLKSKANYKFDLPDIIAVVNQSLSNEIDKIANTAIAKTFLPMVTRFLTREKKEVNFSEMLKMVIDEYHTDLDQDEFSCNIETNDKYGWLDITVRADKRTYKMTLHKKDKKAEEGKSKYQLLSLPYKGVDDSDRYASKKTMKISLDGVTLELPFTSDVLADEFVAYGARIMMADSEITMDCEDFTEDMFPERCHC